MATKIRIAKIENGTRPLGRPAPPHTAAKLAGLYLLALRSHLARTHASTPRRKLKVTIPITDIENGKGVPQHIKITHT